MNSIENLKLVFDALKRVIKFYQQHPAAILTESDLKCEVYYQLRSIDALGVPSATADFCITGHSIHSEIKFFDKENSLRIAPDICLFKPSEISIERGLGAHIKQLPSKGFHATGSPIIIELKFVRTKNISQRTFRDICKDRSKWINENTASRNFSLIQAVLCKSDTHFYKIKDLLDDRPLDRRYSYILGSRENICTSLLVE